MTKVRTDDAWIRVDEAAQAVKSVVGSDTVARADILNCLRDGRLHAHVSEAYKVEAATISSAFRKREDRCVFITQSTVDVKYWRIRSSRLLVDDWRWPFCDFVMISREKPLTYLVFLGVRVNVPELHQCFPKLLVAEPTKSGPGSKGKPEAYHEAYRAIIRTLRTRGFSKDSFKNQTALEHLILLAVARADGSSGAGKNIVEDAVRSVWNELPDRPL